MKRISIIIILLISGIFAYGQQDAVKASLEYEKQYEKNIKKSRIDGVYIPKNLEEALKELEELSGATSVAKFKRAPEEVIAHKLHFGLGRWIEYNWNMRYGSRYEYYLKELGLGNVDQMIQFTIVSWHRHLNNQPLEVEERVKNYQEVLKKEQEERESRRQSYRK